MAKKSLGAKVSIFPLPVLIVSTYDEAGVPNAFNVAWGGQASDSQIRINIGEHKSTDNIRAKRAFTVAIADAAHVAEADYFGVAKGTKVNKAEVSGLTFVKAEHVDAPVIQEFPLTMEVRVDSITREGNENVVLGTVVNTIADESVLDEKGNVDFDKVHAIAFDSASRSYREVGGIVAKAWNAGLKFTK